MDRPFGQRFSTRSVVMGHHGAIATSHPLATQIGLEILKRGGSAVDAAIAANAALGLMEPTGCGIGGDLFAIVWDGAARGLAGLNASGRSPRGLTLEHLRSLGLARIPSEGPLPVSVPGAVDGWFELSARFGRLPMAELLAPAIAYAREGFPVTEVIAGAWRKDALRFATVPGFADVYLPGGKSPVAGQRFRNPRLAATYTLLAEGGRDAFYRGPVAEQIDTYLRAQGGFLTAADFAEHRSEWVDPVATCYRGHDIWELPPNGQGITVLQMLNLLENIDLAGCGWGSAAHLHAMIETKKLAFEDRARFYADPEFAAVPVERLISKSYARDRFGLFDPARAGRAIPHGDPRLSAGDTVYLAAADRTGTMVSLIQSNFRGMGSGMTPGDLGFGLHNRGEAFALEDRHPNVYAPGKRPFHTIIPGFVTRNREPLMAFGVMGADMQPQGQVQVLTNLIDFEMTLQQAGDAPRLRHDGSSDPCGGRMTDGGTTFLESGFARSAVDELARMGHRVGHDADGFGGYQAVRWDAALGVYLAASESRKDGCAAAY
jgi:gamma-glutamyltranspeptidase/glutathione hydrolase